MYGRFLKMEDTKERIGDKEILLATVKTKTDHQKIEVIRLYAKDAPEKLNIPLKFLEKIASKRILSIYELISAIEDMYSILDTRTLLLSCLIPELDNYLQTVNGITYEVFRKNT